jgi:hypothetical protein
VLLLLLLLLLNPRQQCCLCLCSVRRMHPQPQHVLLLLLELLLALPAAALLLLLLGCSPDRRVDIHPLLLLLLLASSRRVPHQLHRADGPCWEVTGVVQQHLHLCCARQHAGMLQHPSLQHVSVAAGMERR